MLREKELQFMIFNKRGNLVNKGTCKTVNEFTDYEVVKKIKIKNKSYEIVERYFNNELFCKDYSLVDYDTDDIIVKLWYAHNKNGFYR